MAKHASAAGDEEVHELIKEKNTVDRIQETAEGTCGRRPSVVSGHLQGILEHWKYVDRINRIYWIFSQFPDETEKGFID
jgi:hypothetical protein